MSKKNDNVEEVKIPETKEYYNVLRRYVNTNENIQLLFKMTSEEKEIYAFKYLELVNTIVIYYRMFEKELISIDEFISIFNNIPFDKYTSHML